MSTFGLTNGFLQIFPYDNLSRVLYFNPNPPYILLTSLCCLITTLNYSLLSSPLTSHSPFTIPMFQLNHMTRIPHIGSPHLMDFFLLPPLITLFFHLNFFRLLYFLTVGSRKLMPSIKLNIFCGFFFVMHCLLPLFSLTTKSFPMPLAPSVDMPLKTYAIF